MNWKTIGKSLTYSEMRNKIFAVLGMVLVFRFLSAIPVPFGDGSSLRQVLDGLFNSSANSSQFLQFLNVLSGGALANFSIMLIGLGPYINASIIMQLLSRAIPKLEKMQKEGEYERRKLNQATRIIALPLAIIQSIGALFLVKQTALTASGLELNPSITQWVIAVSAMSAASMVLMWLGELITEQGIGNGISILITVGVVSQLPQIIATFATVYDSAASYSVFGLFNVPLNAAGLRYAWIIALAALLVTIFVVYLNEAQRRVKISYAKRVQGNRAYGDVSTMLPIKLISAGVVPIIFAVAFLSIPQFVGELMKNSARWSELGSDLSRIFQNPNATYFATGGREAYIYPIAYFLLVFLFTFFYTSVMFNAKDIAENLNKQGGFVPEVRPGEQTERYLSKIVSRLTLFGALSLGILAILPIIGQIYLPSTQIAIGGTSILITVSVALETLRQLESKALMITYDDYARGVHAAGEDEEPQKKNFLKRFTKKSFTKQGKS